MRGEPGEKGERGHRGKRGWRGHHATPGNFREWGLLVAYLVLVGFVFYDVHQQAQQLDALKHSNTLAIQQRNTIVHNQGIIIHNEVVLCKNQQRFLYPAAGECTDIRNDYQP